MTNELFRDDAYLQKVEAVVTAIDERGIQFDQTIFYPTGGGQPGDTGKLVFGGTELAVTDTFKCRDSGDHLHKIGDGEQSAQDTNLKAGDKVSMVLDWDRRHRLMRMHSCMHMLCALIDAPVTGGSVQDGRGRLDFDLADPVDKVELTDKLKALIAGDHPMSVQWITDEELDQNPDLVRTLSVQPPRGSGRIRLVNFEGVDLQPCGGTHVRSTGEIGDVYVRKVEKKGKMNRRIIVEFTED